MVGTASEHHTLYQYTLAGTKNMFMGQIQTETPYYQPTPPAPAPFADPISSDPDFAAYCPANSSGSGPTCSMAFGLRIVQSQNINVYGADFYSFFNSYSTACSNATIHVARCQKNIFANDAGVSKALWVEALNTIGTEYMFTRGTMGGGFATDNWDVYPSNIIALNAS